MDLGHESDHQPSRQPRYLGEDTTPTSPRELAGWYSYGLAAEVFAVCGVGSFLPVTLEQLARENGVLWSDRTTPCFDPAQSSSPDGAQCLVHFLGLDMTTSSFAMYTFSAAVFVQALVLVSFSAFADHGENRKRLLLVFGWMGAATSMAFMLVFPSMYALAPLLAIIGVTCLGSSFVLLNSFLPLLAANDPLVVNKNSDSAQATSLHKSDQSAASGSRELQLSTKISSKGVGIGYAAAVSMQCVSILILILMNKFGSSTSATKTLPLRTVLLASGLWWAAFTCPAALWLRKRPGPPLESGNAHGARIRRYFAYVGFAWSSLWKTIGVAVKLKQAAMFLLAWFLLSDAVATVSGTAILFARTELKMGTVPIALLSITATTSGILGAFIWPIISRHFGWKTNRTIVACMILMEIIPLYGLLGYLPFIQRLGFGGLQQSWEIFPLGVIHGTVMGGISSYCRSFFGLLIPPGSEVAFYALFAITDKGSSAIGPAIVGRIVDQTGHIRPAFIFLAILIALPIPLVWYVDADSGQEDARRMAIKLRGLLADTDVRGIELRLQRDEESERLMGDM